MRTHPNTENGPDAIASCGLAGQTMSLTIHANGDYDGETVGEKLRFKQALLVSEGFAGG
jgi:hypothetical protein